MSSSLVGSASEWMSVPRSYASQANTVCVCVCVWGGGGGGGGKEEEGGLGREE